METPSSFLAFDLLVVEGRSLFRWQHRHAIAELKPLRLWRDGVTVGMFVHSGLSADDKLTGCTPLANIAGWLRALLAVRPELAMVTDTAGDAPWLTEQLGVAVSVSEMGVREQERARIAAEQRPVEQEQIGPQVQVKAYTSESQFQEDATTMVKGGWHIEGQSSRTKNYSLLTGVLTNKGITTVTWIKASVRTEEAPSPAPAAVEDIPAKLAQAAAMRDAGLITAEEYEAKKVELLSRL